MENLNNIEKSPSPLPKSFLSLILMIEFVSLGAILMLISITLSGNVFGSNGEEGVVVLLSTIIVAVLGYGLSREKKWGLYTFSIITIIQIYFLKTFFWELINQDNFLSFLFAFIVSVKIVALIWTWRIKERFV